MTLVHTRTSVDCLEMILRTINRMRSKMKHLLVLNLNWKGNEHRKPSHAMQLKLHKATPIIMKLSPLIAVIRDSLRNRSNHHRSKPFSIPPHMNHLPLTETIFFYWDCVDLSIQVSAKSDVTGIGEVKDWADKLASMKFLHPFQCSASTNSRYSQVRSISSSAVASTPFKDPTCASSPTNDAASES